MISQALRPTRWRSAPSVSRPRARTTLKTGIKNLFLAALSRLTRRHAIILAAEATGGILPVVAPYRVEGAQLGLSFPGRQAGRLRAELRGYEGFFPTVSLWRTDDLALTGPAQLTLDVSTGAVYLGEAALGHVPVPLPHRFCWDLTLERDGGGPRLHRLTGHYVPIASREVGEEYFSGDNYVDHEQQSAGEGSKIAHWLTCFAVSGPVLEVGCATGLGLETLREAGFSAYGLDFSPWAVKQAQARVGADRAFLCDAASDPLPPEIEARAPFGALVLWSVLEHFAAPFATLERLTPLVAPGGLLLLQTTNCESLTSRLFGGDWEGYFDWTHQGVTQVSTTSMRRELPRLGWRIEHLNTHLLWTGSADPCHATLREWYDADARFRDLLAEKDLGDFLLVVARREGA